MHDYGLILLLAAGFSIALVCGYITQRLGLSPIVGYLLAGIVVGPYTPGFVADAGLAGQLAEIGVILLMFGVGLHFRLSDLLAVKSIAIPGAVGQSIASTFFGLAIGLGFGWDLGSSLILGVAASVASTVVLIRVVDDNNLLDSPQGHIAIGWLIVEDIFTVLVLVLLPAFANVAASTSGWGGILGAVSIAVVKLVVLSVLILYFGAKIIPWLLKKVVQLRSRELFTLTILVLAIVIATTSAIVFGASFALGAFLAGMVVGQSKSGHQAAADALPMRDAFAVLFFVSVGMLFDPRFVIDNPLLVLLGLLSVIVGKPLVAFVIVIVFGYSVRAALTVALALGQIGEFTFILSTSALQLGLFSAEGQNALIAVALISISLNPLMFTQGLKLEHWLKGKPRVWNFLNRRTIARANSVNARALEKASGASGGTKAIVVGYGPVGKTVTRMLIDFNIHPVVIELNFDTVDSLNETGCTAIYGDAGSTEILGAAGIKSAQFLIVTIPDPGSRAPVIATAKQLNENVVLIVRARYIAEQEEFKSQGVTAVCYEEVEAAVGLSQFVLEKVGVAADQIQAETERIRAEFAV